VEHQGVASQGVCVCTNQPGFPGRLTVDVADATQTVDRFNNLFVTAFVSPGSAKFLLLHDGKNDDSIRNFFLEVYDLYLRVRLSFRCLECSTGRFDAACSLLWVRLPADWHKLAGHPQPVSHPHNEDHVKGVHEEGQSRRKKASGLGPLAVSHVQHAIQRHATHTVGILACLVQTLDGRKHPKYRR
jgi:hypothetical protein